MARRENHYELAFEEYLRARRVAYVAVDEARRSLLGEGSLKSLDFLLPSSRGTTWLVDVKGRGFPAGGKQYWRNWSTEDDVHSLARWEGALGQGFHALFVFAYSVVGDRAPLPADQLFAYRGRLYGFVGIRLRDYAAHARRISPKWDTLAMPAKVFRRLAEPLEALL